MQRTEKNRPYGWRWNDDVVDDITELFTRSTFIPSYGSYYSTTTQGLISTSNPQAITLTDSWVEQGMQIVDGSKIQFDKAGVYQLNFVIQISNPENNENDAWFWVKYMGDNFPNSTTKVTLAKRQGSGTNTTQLVTVNILGVAINNNDYIELWWAGTSTNLDLIEAGQQVSPIAIPEIPSVKVSIHRVG